MAIMAAVVGGAPRAATAPTQRPCAALSRPRPAPLVENGQPEPNIQHLPHALADHVRICIVKLRYVLCKLTGAACDCALPASQMRNNGAANMGRKLGQISHTQRWGWKRLVSRRARISPRGLGSGRHACCFDSPFAVAPVPSPRHRQPLESCPGRDWATLYRDAYSYDDSYIFMCTPNCAHNCYLRPCVKNDIVTRCGPTRKYHKGRDVYETPTSHAATRATATRAWPSRGASTATAASGGPRCGAASRNGSSEACRTTPTGCRRRNCFAAAKTAPCRSAGTRPTSRRHRCCRRPSAITQGKPAPAGSPPRTVAPR